MEGSLEEEMFPGGWNSQIETNNIEYDPDHVQSFIENKEMIPSEWISQREVVNTPHNPVLVEDNMEEKDSAVKSPPTHTHWV